MFKNIDKFHIKRPYITGQSRIHMISIGVNPVPPPKYGGIETVVANLSAGLARNQHKVRIYSPGGCDISGVEHVQTMPEARQIYENGLLVINPKEHVTSIIEALKKDYQPGDIVHFHHLSHAKDLDGIVETSVNLCETAHWKVTGLANNICYPSHALATHIGKQGQVVSHGIDMDFWVPSSIIKSEKASPLYVGRLTKDKGLDIAVAACVELNARLRVAGPLPDPSNAFGQNILKKVDYLGEKTPEELISLYSQAPVMLYMTQYCEPFGLAIVEAMACGCPVITTGNGATKETVEEGVSGYFATTAKDISDLYEKAITVDRNKCIERAKLFSIDEQVKQQIQAYAAFFSIE